VIQTIFQAPDTDQFPDWIAHGILDSIVDAFFPVLTEIEKEVMYIDRLVYIDEEEEDSASTLNDQGQSSTASSSTVKSDLGAELTKSKSPDEKPTPERVNTLDDNLSIRPHFKRPRPTVRLLFRRARRSVARVWNRLWEKKPEVRINPRTLTLRRMAKTRKLVTLLGRLLASKADVVTQIRKRLLQQSGQASLGNGGTKGEELEVAIYMGDVQGILSVF
jgi:magnesium transporter